MKIAIVGEHNRKGGGSYHQSLKTYEILTTIKNIQFNFLTNNSKEKFDEMGQNFINYNTNFIDQLFFLFYSSNIFKRCWYKIMNLKSYFFKRVSIKLRIT